MKLSCALFFTVSATAMTSTMAFVSPSDASRATCTKIHQSDRKRDVSKPPVLDGTFPGDFGFDPLGFAKTQDDLIWNREAEIKHSRLAMLAAVGWPLSELWDRNLANTIGVQPAVDAGERAPSLLNGGLDRVLPGYWVATFLVTALIEYRYTQVQDKPGYFPGNLGFDPMGLYPSDKAGQRRIQLAEVRNGRLAMLAVLSYALQEFVYRQGVVELTPAFFKPMWN